MDDKTKLLESLQIKREPEVHAASSPSSAGWWAAGVLAAALLGALLWWWTHDRNEVRGAEAAVVATSSAAATVSVPVSNSTLDASGYVVARRMATVSPSGQTGGKVIEVLIKEGSRVVKGDVLARLDDRAARLQLAQYKAQLDTEMARLHASEVALKNAEPLYQRINKVRQTGGYTVQDLDNAKATYDSAQANYEVAKRTVAEVQASVERADQNVADTVVRAPFDGVITAKNADLGEFVMPGAAGGTRTGIGTIVDMNSLEVEVDVSENYINRVKPGQVATVKLNAYPDWEIPAKVIAIIPTADRAKATVKVRIGFEQRDARILPDMGARVSFLGG